MEKKCRKKANNPQINLYVLQQLIQQGEGGSFVWLADQSDGVARKTTIQTGAVGANGLVEVTSGLTVSSRIISNGSDGLTNGERIKVTSEDAMLGTKTGIAAGDGSLTPDRLSTGGNE